MDRTFVGVLLILMGVFQSVSIIRRWSWVVNFYRIRVLRERWGDKAAFAFLHIVNIAIMAIGILILLGFYG